MSFTMNRRSILGAGVAISGLGLMPSVVRAQKASVPITIALSSNSLGLAPLRIAVHGGMFKDAGLDASITVMDSGNAAMTALISGSVQLAAPGLSEALLVRARGQRVVIIANVHRGLGTSLILSKKVADQLGVAPDAPLEARAKALDGLKVALPSATSPSVAAFVGAASVGGATFDQVYMAQPAMVPAMETDAVHAMVAAAPAWLRPVKSGSGYLWISGPRGDIPAEFMTASSACLQASESYARSNPEVVEATRQAMKAAADLILNDPDQAKKLLGEIYTDLDAADISMVFDTAYKNWAKPVITVEDVRHEQAILKASGLGNEAVQNVDPAELLSV